jgi:hypothetical protein
VKKESGSCDGLAFFIWECCARAGESADSRGGRPGCLQQPQPSTASLHHSATAYRLAWVASVGGLRGLGVEKTRGDRGSSVPFVGPVPIISHGEMRAANCELQKQLQNSPKTAQRQPQKHARSKQVARRPACPCSQLIDLCGPLAHGPSGPAELLSHESRTRWLPILQLQGGLSHEPLVE